MACDKMPQFILFPKTENTLSRLRNLQAGRVNKKILIDAIGFLLIALVVVAGYKLSPILLPKSDVTVLPDTRCDLHKEICGATLPDGGRLELSFGTRPIPLVKPFRVEVKVTGNAAKSVAIDFDGVDMKMGLNRPLLRNEGAGLFAGEVTLPVCITGAMEWQATVLLETAGQSIAIPYRFTSGVHQ